MFSLKRVLAGSLLLCSTASWADSFSLPIWKEEAEALGYVLPKPFGFNVSYMSLEQGIAVDSIGFEGLAIKGKPSFFNKDGITPIHPDIVASPGRQSSEVLSLRADVWVFPFLNLYGLIGKMKGQSETMVTVKGVTLETDKKDIHIPLQGVKPFSFKLDLEGELFGGGLVLAGGYKNWFALLDASYTQTDLSVIDGAIDAYVVSPRVGYDFHSKGVPMRLWAGAMYQDVEQSLSGSISSLGLPSFLDDFTEDGKFNVEQRLTTPWNPIIGMQYQISPHLYLLGEAGLGDRTSVFFSIDMRY
ncbi:TonB-dependent receptor [Grimontia sp. SpTr1]|uniref:TonB-dependent receptor n=1 Tax=Grimontia sp. SpTr1 TaxID=2995319 RepID=UPI00248B2B21|nr:TonB-dependent receptor [Grimontia sp. SpTr1]